MPRFAATRRLFFRVRLATGRSLIVMVCTAAAGFFSANVLAVDQPARSALPTVTLSTPVTTVTTTLPTSTTVPVPPLSTTVTTPTISTTVPTPPISTTVPTPTISTTVPTPTISTTVPTPTISTTVPTPTISTTVPTPPISTTVPPPTISTTVTVSTPVTTVKAPVATVKAPVATTTAPAPTVRVTVPTDTGRVTSSVAAVTSTAPRIPSPTTGAISTTGSDLAVNAPTGGRSTGTATVERRPGHPSTGTASASAAFAGPGQTATPLSAAPLQGAGVFGDSNAPGFMTGPAREHAPPLLVVSSRPGRAAIVLRPLRARSQLLPGRVKRFAVELRFLLSGPARVTFLVLGPRPRCTIAARIVTAGHPGLNRIRFTGRIGDRRLEPGIYTIVSRSALGVSRRLWRVAVKVDNRGAHPAALVPWPGCSSTSSDEAKFDRSFPSFPLFSFPLFVSRFAGIEATIATRPAAPAGVSPERLVPRSGLPISLSTAKDWLSIAVLLLASMTLLGVATLEPPHAATRYRLVRVIEARRVQVVAAGAVLLVTTIVLFLVARLPA
jgi:hypothetical protein